MFTGIIQALGRIDSIERKDVDWRLRIVSDELEFGDVALGDSIAVNGVCLTAVEKTAHSFTADVSGETLSRSTYGDFSIGSPVNLEKALTLSTPLGGHLVSGHVDGVGELISMRDEGRSIRFEFRAPDNLARYIAEKGSICIDGTSLTVNHVNGACFDVNIVPHTMSRTVMANYKVGTRVNLEVDLIARYTERLLLGEAAAKPESRINEAFLAQHGFLK